MDDLLKGMVGVQAMLLVAAAALALAHKVRSSFAAAALAPLLVLAVLSYSIGQSGSWDRLGKIEIGFLAAEALVMLASAAGIVWHPGVSLLWVVWTGNLLAFLALFYMAFFFHVF